MVVHYKGIGSLTAYLETAPYLPPILQTAMVSAGEAFCNARPVRFAGRAPRPNFVSG